VKPAKDTKKIRADITVAARKDKWIREGLRAGTGSAFSRRDVSIFLPDFRVDTSG